MPGLYLVTNIMGLYYSSEVIDLKQVISSP